MFSGQQLSVEPVDTTYTCMFEQEIICFHHIIVGLRMFIYLFILL